MSGIARGVRIIEVARTVPSPERVMSDGRRRPSLRALRAEMATLPDPAERRSGGGRAWINGREVGGRGVRFEHLDGSHD